MGSIQAEGDCTAAGQRAGCLDKLFPIPLTPMDKDQPGTGAWHARSDAPGRRLATPRASKGPIFHNRPFVQVSDQYLDGQRGCLVVVEASQERIRCAPSCNAIGSARSLS
jgi:hypothetical protein